MASEILTNIIYFINLTFENRLLWTIFPLAVATIVMLVYFERYSDEKPGWNTYVANSLVLLFVSVILFRYIFSIENKGAVNFINFPEKTTVATVILILGITILSLNFRHYLPEKIAHQVSSPLNLNLVAYIAILYVYSEITDGVKIWISLIVMFALLLLVLNIVRNIFKQLFKHLQRMKEKEEIEDVKSEKKKIQKKKRQLKKEEKKIAMAKLREAEKQKKQALKLKKIIRKK